MSNEAIWIFGYGSLIFRPGFAFDERVVGRVSGFERRFWQASTDHRGTPDRPGRVVTLVEAEGKECWGVAYRVPSEDRAAILDELEIREKGGYRTERLAFEGRGGKGPSHVQVYIGREDNPNYIGPESDEQIAEIARSSEGPSGHNVEYVLKLAEALLEEEIVDEHVMTLANLLIDPDGAFER